MGNWCILFNFRLNKRWAHLKNWKLQLKFLTDCTELFLPALVFSLCTTGLATVSNWIAHDSHSLQLHNPPSSGFWSWFLSVCFLKYFDKKTSPLFGAIALMCGNGGSIFFPFASSFTWWRKAGLEYRGWSRQYRGTCSQQQSTSPSSFSICWNLCSRCRLYSAAPRRVRESAISGRIPVFPKWRMRPWNISIKLSGRLENHLTNWMSAFFPGLTPRYISIPSGSWMWLACFRLFASCSLNFCREDVKRSSGTVLKKSRSQASKSFKFLSTWSPFGISFLRYLV